LGEGGHQQHIVEGERFAEKAHEESSRRKSELYGPCTKPRFVTESTLDAGGAPVNCWADAIARPRHAP
ncbi:MAG TPA: hypothetical protein PKJ32_15230, partial [Piscinibacter sp.]|nr:hypothetical protein [Piscinibacter sp.]